MTDALDREWAARPRHLDDGRLYLFSTGWLEDAGWGLLLLTGVPKRALRVREGFGLWCDHMVWEERGDGITLEKPVSIKR